MSDTGSPLSLRRGFLTFPRGLVEWPVYQSLRAEGRQVVLVLLLRANYAPGEFWFAGQRIPLEPGQLIDGEENIAKLAGVSRKVARTAIDRLTKGGFLDRRPAHPAGQCPYIITIKDYAHLLFNEPQEGPPNGQPQGDDGAKNGPTTGLEGAPSEQGNKGKPGEPLNNEPQLTPDPLDSISGA